jgi:nucleotide-binding universal stress UspA family protein
VVGSSHRGRVGQVLAGNVALRLLNGLDRPLAVAPASYARFAASVRTIGVGFNATPESRAALRTAGDFAQAAGAAVRVVEVAEPHPALVAHPGAFGWGAGAAADRYDERARAELESAADDLPSGVSRSTEFHFGVPAAILMGQARHLDLLVLGSRGYGPI